MRIESVLDKFYKYESARIYNWVTTVSIFKHLLNMTTETQIQVFSTLCAGDAKALKRKLEDARNLILNDSLVAMPTETVYGLAANALSADAVAKIFAAKNRPQGMEVNS